MPTLKWALLYAIMGPDQRSIMGGLFGGYKMEKLEWATCRRQEGTTSQFQARL
jgi:hypothetical protein